MTTPAKKCAYGIDCRRKPNAQTGRCDLHDALAVLLDAEDHVRKAIGSLSRMEQLDREEADRDDQSAEDLASVTEQRDGLMAALSCLLDLDLDSLLGDLSDEVRRDRRNALTVAVGIARAAIAEVES